MITKPKNILIISTRQIGDALLTTPLIHSLRLAYPEAKLDVLVFKGAAEGVLMGNPDISEILAVPHHPTFKEYLRLIKRLFRRYDLAISTLTGDRPIFYAFLAGKKRISLVEPTRTRDQWKRKLLSVCVDLDDDTTHTVTQNLKLVEALKIQKHYQVIPPYAPDTLNTLKQKLPFDVKQSAYVVLHLCPMWNYKRWPMLAWRELIRFILSKNLNVVLTGGNAKDELDYIQAVLSDLSGDIYNLAGQLNFAEVATLITEAKFYVGTDTAVTHIAASTGTLSIALFGPTNPLKWAPWPKDYQAETPPFPRVGSSQVGNVILIQGETTCVPCHQEGCERHKLSYSRCLDELSSHRVMAALEKIL